MGTNIFKMLNLETKENIHSSFITSVFNSSKFAKEEFIKILNKVSGKEFEHEKLKAQTEKVLSSDKSARVDIYITNYKDIEEKGDTRIIIENKIYVGDQNKQLKRYHNHLKNDKYKKTALFYLTLEGKNATKFSHDDLKSEYILLNYAEHIQKWLKQVKENDTIDSKLKIYIEDYQVIIEELTKYNLIIENGFIENRGFDEWKYNTLLELRFWQELEEAIVNNQKRKYLIDNQHRYYTYSKILKANKPRTRGEISRDYGLVIKINDTSRNIRISVNPKEPSKLISIRIGKFGNNNWINENTFKVNDNKLSTLNLTNIGYMNENHIKRIIEEIEKIY